MFGFWAGENGVVGRSLSGHYPRGTEEIISCCFTGAGGVKGELLTRIKGSEFRENKKIQREILPKGKIFGTHNFYKTRSWLVCCKLR